MRMYVVSVTAGMALVGAAWGATGNARADEDELVKVGDPAPLFSLPLYNAEAQKRAMFSLDSLVGPDADEPAVKAVLMSFFATFCAPCKREMPYLEKLNEQFRDQGLRVVMISIDRDEGAAAKIDALVKQNKVSFPILKDRFNFLARRYLGETAPLPSVFLISRDGVVRELNRGYGKDASTFLLTSVERVLGVSGGESKKTIVASPQAH
jgi:thiol-disulfide isomerase/thioredoxin